MNTNTVDSLAPRPAPAIALMVLLHLGLLGVLLQVRAPSKESSVELQAPIWLQLFAPPAAVDPNRTPGAAPLSSPTTPRRATPSRPTPAAGETTLFVAPEAPAANAAPPAPAAAETAAPAPPPRPLNLSLPRGASAPYRHPALDDPRSNTRPATLESRLAEFMGSSDGPVSEEHMPDGSLRLRRGSSCVIVRPSRAGSLDPFNQSVSPKPRQVDSC